MAGHARRFLELKVLVHHHEEMASKLDRKFEMMGIRMEQQDVKQTDLEMSTDIPELEVIPQILQHEQKSEEMQLELQAKTEMTEVSQTRMGVAQPVLLKLAGHALKSQGL